VQDRVLYHHACAVPPCLTTIGRYPQSVTLRIPDLPVVNPFTLAQADAAYNVAKQATLAGLQAAVATESDPQELVVDGSGQCNHTQRRKLAPDWLGAFCCKRRKQC